MEPLPNQRLSAILSASYSDADIRNALDVLDARFVSNSPDARRNLRVDVQHEVIQNNVQIIREFSQLSQQLRQIGSALSSINSVVSHMRTHVNRASSETAPVLDEASSLISQKKDIESKQLLLDAFINHFVVPEEDILVLTSSAEPVNDRFFQILSRVKNIHRDCQALLASENQRAGIEIMDQMAKHLYAAFQKLYHWVQRELKHLSLENPQINAGIRRALRVLAERPALFHNCLDFFAEARQKIVLDSFYAALTGALPASSTQAHIDPASKPIELYAHDPLRYIGDMLAWLHSATVGEQEALEVLFISHAGDDEGQSSILGGIEEGLKSEPWVEDGDADGDGENVKARSWDAKKGLMMLVDKDLQLVCSPLKLRIEQVIASHENSTLAYRISNLINFYRLTFEKHLDEDSFLLNTVKSVEESALRQFHSILQDHVRAVQSDLPQAPEDLSPPEFLVEALNELKQLMASYDTSLAPLEHREEEFYRILEEALDPYLSGCEELGRDLRAIDRIIFSLNCLFAAKAILEQFSFTKERLNKLQHEVEQHKKSLVDHQYNFFVHASGLHPLLVALSDWDPKTTRFTQLLAFSTPSLVEVSQALDAFLSSALMDAQAELRGLTAPKIVGECTHEAADRFIEDFRKVETAIVEGLREDDERGVDVARSVWPRTAEEVRVLLS
ncbi:Golgi transport complex subunit 6 [Rhizina undulata]